MDTTENIRGIEEDKGKNEETATADMKIVEAVVRSGQLEKNIFSGIPLEVILDIITPRLSWIDWRILFSTTPWGLEAIESRLIYNRRLRTQSTESLVIFTQARHLSSLLGESAPRCMKTLFACALRNKSFYELPPIPGCYEAIPRCCQAQSLDGKLYVLGGLMAPDDIYHGSKEVYVLDLAGQMQWKPCASMRESRSEFASAVMEGKIYVFGGTDYDVASERCEVYDPKLDAWTWIEPMHTFRRGHKIAAMGDELVIYYEGLIKGDAEVYHTVNDEWRVIADYVAPPRGAFAVHGKFLYMIGPDIYGSDINGEYFTRFQGYSSPDREGSDVMFGGQGLAVGSEGSFTRLQGCSYPDWERGDNTFGGHGLAVGDELLVVEFHCDGPLRLLLSSGFGQENTELVWSEIMTVQDDCSLLCSIEL